MNDGTYTLLLRSDIHTKAEAPHSYFNEKKTYKPNFLQVKAANALVNAFFMFVDFFIVTVVSST